MVNEIVIEPWEILLQAQQMIDNAKILDDEYLIEECEFLYFDNYDDEVDEIIYKYHVIGELSPHDRIVLEKYYALCGQEMFFVE